MPPRIDDATRTAIEADIRTGKKSRNQIARDHNVAPSTVTRVAQEAGLDGAFDRSNTKRATEIAEADARARRARLALDLLDDAQRLRQRAWTAYTQCVPTRTGNVEVITLDLPPLAEVRNAYTALGIAVDKSLALERVDSDDGADAARSMLARLGDALTEAAGTPPAVEDTDSGSR